MLSSWKSAILRSDALVSDAVRVLDETSLRIVLITDSSEKLLGTITDGDVRRGLIGHIGMSDLVSKIMNTSPITASVAQSREAILALMRRWDILQVPVIDSEGLVVQVEFLQDLTSIEPLNNPVLLMAGGFGKRLYPLTIDTPKPMLKVGSKPMLEKIIGQLVEYGFYKIYIAICYKGEVVRDYFGDGSAWGVEIQYLEETEPLGTGGALGMLPDDDKKMPVLLMNGDILTKVDFRRLLDFHGEHDGRITMCVREFDFQVPYGVVEISERCVLGMVEKPGQKVFVNAGIYIVDNDIADRSDKFVAIDMPDLVNEEVKRGGRVNAFPIYEYWLDIGVMDQYEKAQVDIVRFSDDR